MLSFAFAVIPFMMPQNMALGLVLLGIGYTMLTIKVQRTLSDPAKMREIQAKIKALTNEMQEAAKRKEDVSSKQSQLMPLMGESMKLQMKSMFVILPMFYLVYYLGLPALLGPYNGAMTNLVVISLASSGLFFATILIGGLTASLVMMQYDKRKMAAKAGSQAQNSQPASQAMDVD